MANIFYSHSKAEKKKSKTDIRLLIFITDDLVGMRMLVFMV